MTKDNEKEISKLMLQALNIKEGVNTSTYKNILQILTRMRYVCIYTDVTRSIKSKSKGLSWSIEDEYFYLSDSWYDVLMKKINNY